MKICLAWGYNWWSLLGLSFYVATVTAQPYRFKHFTTDQGLSQNSVVDIVQDKSGLLWLATQDGLNRYDGYEVTYFEEYFRDITRPSYSQLGKVFIDSKNRLWTANLGGHLQWLDRDTGKFSRTDGINEVSVMQEDSASLWVGTYGNGLFNLNAYSQDFSLTKFGFDRQIYELLVEEDRILLATDNGIWSFSRVTKEFEVMTNTIGRSFSKILHVDGEYILGTYGSGIWRTEDFRFVEQEKACPDRLLVQDLLYHDDLLWIATYGDGAYTVDANGFVTQYRHNPANSFSINYNDIISLFADVKGNVWLGTDGGGVSILSKTLNRFGGISREQVPINYPVDVPRAIVKDQFGALWIGTSGKGLTRMDAKTGTFHHYSTASKSGLLSDRIVSLQEGEHGIWIGTQGECLDFVPFENAPDYTVPQKLDCQTIWDIFRDIDGTLWLATRDRGILSYNPKSTELITHLIDEDAEQDDRNNVRVLAGGERGYLYVGTEDGVIYEFTMSTGRFRSISLPDSVNTGPIKSLYIDGDEMWIGTQQAGLLRLNVKSRSLRIINRDNGLPNNVIYAVIPQDDEYLWVSTNHGISQLDRTLIDDPSAKYVIQNLSKSDGLLSNEYNTGAYFKDNDGIVYFGGLEGVTWFDPKDIVPDDSPVDVILYNLTHRSGEGLQVLKIQSNSVIRLRPDQTDFQITYSAIDYLRSEKLKYRYRLNGFQEDFIDNGTGRLAHFTNVPSGTYVFELYATNADGLWNQIPSTLKLVVITPWHQTWWAYALWGILGMSLIATGYKMRTNYIRRKEAEKYEISKQMANLELQLLRTQMNPHFMFNSLNSIKNYILKSEINTAAEYLSSFAHLIRLILQNSRQQLITLEEELETLKLYIALEKIRLKGGFDFILIIEDHLDLDMIMVPPMIIQPYVENAIWHGLRYKEKQKILELSVARSNGEVHIIVDDNGIGRKEAGRIKSRSKIQYKPMGMGITHERVEILNRSGEYNISVDVLDKFDTDGAAAGTRVVLKIPQMDFN